VAKVSKDNTAPARSNGGECLGKKLLKTTNKLQTNMRDVEYKHVVLGFIFLKYISDIRKELYQKLIAA
jgi:type I restriction enzyme M protein